MIRIAGWILEVIDYLKDKNLANNQATLDKLDKDKYLRALKVKVNAFASKFPMPGL